MPRKNRNITAPLTHAAIFELLDALTGHPLSTDTVARIRAAWDDALDRAYRQGWLDCRSVGLDVLRRGVRENPDDQPE